MVNPGEMRIFENGKIALKKERNMLKIGDMMPSFEVLDQDGQVVKSEDFIGKGRKTIIYFSPKDNTSGCTAEACSFRDNYAELTAAGYNVVGVSKDSAKSHTGFRARYGLPFRLLGVALVKGVESRWIPHAIPRMALNLRLRLRRIRPV